ncbi:MAG: SDR family NAD(P)-dependent oxidoreductase [Candidatus Sungiibacteriota bacterium]
MNNLGLENKTAIVTGATGGIGLAIALLLAKNGANVFINSRDKDSAVGIAEKYQREGLSIKGIEGDVSDEKAVKDCVHKVFRDTDRIDILINNAGTSSRRVLPLEEIETDLWDSYLDTHLKGSFLFCRAVIPTMKKRKAGKIINIASIVALVPDGSAHYTSAKSGLVGLTKSLALELAPFNIQVNAVAPGLVGTPSAKRNYPPSFFRKAANLTPAKRVAAPDDIAKAVLFFSSSLSDFVSGQVLAVDGGFTLIFV